MLAKEGAELMREGNPPLHTLDAAGNTLDIGDSGVISSHRRHGLADGLITTDGSPTDKCPAQVFGVLCCAPRSCLHN